MTISVKGHSACDKYPSSAVLTGHPFHLVANLDVTHITTVTNFAAGCLVSDRRWLPNTDLDVFVTANSTLAQTRRDGYFLH